MIFGPGQASVEILKSARHRSDKVGKDQRGQSDSPRKTKGLGLDRLWHFDLLWLVAKSGHDVLIFQVASSSERQLTQVARNLGDDVEYPGIKVMIGK